MYVATNAANQSIVAAFEEMVERVAGRADLVVVGEGGTLDAERVSDIADLDDVAHAAAVVEIPIRESHGGEPLLVLGVDFLGDTHFLPLDVDEGEQRVVEDPLAFVNDPSAILVSRTLAERRGLDVGSKLDLMTSVGPKALVVRGVLDDSGLGAAFGGQVAIMSIDAAQMAFARGTLVDRIDVALEDGVDAEAARRAIAEVAVGGRVERPGERVRRIQKLMEPFQNGVFLSGFVALIVGMFLIYNAVGIAVAQRRREIGVLRAIGLARGRAVLLFTIEAVLMALPGVLVGLVAAQWGARLALDQTTPTIAQVFVPIRPPPPVVTAELALRGAVAGLLTTIVAALLPAFRAARVNPVESLRPAATSGMAAHVPVKSMTAVAGVLIGASWLTARTTTDPFLGACGLLLNVAGSVLLVPAGVVLLHGAVCGVADRLFGVPGRLGVDNVERTLGRSALNVAALMAAVAMTVTVSGWLSSLQGNIRKTLDTLIASDLQITAGSPLNDQYNVRFGASSIDAASKVAGVAAVVPARVLELDVNDVPMRLVGVESRAYLAELGRRGKLPEIVAGPGLAPGDLVGERRIVVNEAAARSLSLGPGSEATFASPTGKVTFAVHAVFVDHSEAALGYVDRAHFVERWKDDSVDNIDVVIAQGADVEAVAAELRRKLGGGELLFVTRSSAVADEVMKVVDQAFTYARSVELVTLLIALLGVVATMTAAVLDRLREIGMLRAIGALRRQVVGMVVTEAAFLGIVAAVTGVAVGAVQGALLLTVLESIGKGMRVDYVFPTETAVRVAALVALTAAVAGVLPGRRAATTDVKEALGYE